MAEARLALKMQDWHVEHTNLYLSSGGKEGHAAGLSGNGRPIIAANHDRSEVRGEIYFPVVLRDNWR